MRLRLQTLLPLSVGLVVAAGFVVAAAAVENTVRDALLTIPGLSRERAVDAAVAAVILAGIAFTTLAVSLSVWLAGLVAGPLRRMEQAAHGLTEGRSGPGLRTAIAEIQDVVRGMDRTSTELRSRHENELREQAELAALVEAVSEGILQVGPDGRVARLNEPARRLLGLPDDVIGRPVASQLRNEELRRIVAGTDGEGGNGAAEGAWADAGGRAASAAEVALDDRRILVSVSRQADGGRVATFVDLTDLRRLEEVRRDFVANASHELKTPLTSIRGYTETLLDGDLPDAERQQFLATIARNAERLQRIVDDLLDLSRLETGKWQPELDRVDVAEVAESCWHAFADRAGDQGVRFSVDPQGGRHALADRRALDQMFSNLYDNALRYTPGHGEIRVTTRIPEDRPPSPGRPPADAGGEQESPSDGWLIVDVADTGAGIPRDSLPRIFERFYRVDPARSRAEGGTGLGLSIVKHMVESMGGAISADSVLGKGTTIRLWLPRPRERSTAVS